MNIFGCHIILKVNPGTLLCLFYRPKRRGLLRNVAVALGNWAHESAIPALSLGLQDPEPLVRSHAAWALGRISASQAKINLKAAKTTEKDPSVLEEIEAALSS